MTVNERLYPTDDEKKKAGRILTDIFDNEANYAGTYSPLEDLRWWFETWHPGVEPGYAMMKDAQTWPDDKLPQLAVDMFDVQLFEGKSGADLRDMMLDCMTNDGKRQGQLRSIYVKANTKLDEDGKKEAAMEWPNKKKKYIAELKNHKRYKWMPGRSFARIFVRQLGFPEIFSGIPSDPSEENDETILTRPKYFELAPFQKNMYLQILEILNLETSKKRAIVTLPTGAGKTKTTVEALIESWKNNKYDFIVWIAQNEELCDQAFACIKQIWEEKGLDGEALKLFRVYRSRPLPSDGERGIIVGGVSQLSEYIKDYSLYNFGQRNTFGAVVIDEAHRSATSSYRNILKCLGIGEKSGGREEVPLLGLTATPERSSEPETKRLRAMYDNRRIHPAPGYPDAAKDVGNRLFDKKWESLLWMKDRLEELKYLARPDFQTFDPNMSREEQTLDENETEDFENDPFEKIPDEYMKRLGQNAKRNMKTFKEIKKWADDTSLHKDGRQILFFGANKTQAIIMSKFLKDAGYESATIVSETRYGARRSYIRRFTEGHIKVLCNYEVLATGFDSPKIDTLMIARPTGSKIIYQQMVGRGLRGPKFGGTPECTIITVKDNLYRFEGDKIKLGYEAYQDELKEEG